MNISRKKIPKIAEFILAGILNRKDNETLLGDIEEIFTEISKSLRLSVNKAASGKEGIKKCVKPLRYHMASLEYTG